MNASDLKGIIPPIVTPTDENEDVDEGGLRKLIDHCIAKGLHGIFIAGTNGESLSLTQEQRDRAIGIALSEAKGRVPVLAGVMDSSTRRVIENIKRVKQMGGIQQYKVNSVTGPLAPTRANKGVAKTRDSVYDIFPKKR